MIGKRFGKWEVLAEFHDKNPGKHYECMCDCGNIRIIPGTTLRAGRSKQCTKCQYNELYNPEREIGKKYGKWTVIKFVDMHRKLQRFETQCKCGNIGLHAAADLRAGKSKQCTVCHNKENALKNTVHGMHKSKTYRIWKSMLQRCNNPKCTAYARYGGRGITVCDRWRNFENFLEDMGIQPPGLTLDRTNNNGNYEPSNCRWVTHKENCNNRYY